MNSEFLMKSHDIKAKVFGDSPCLLNRSKCGVLRCVVSVRNELKLLLIWASFLVMMTHSIWAQLAPTAKGCVIYKQQSWFKDSEAVMEEYRSYEVFPAVTNVQTIRDDTMRLLPGQDPVFIPYPKDSRLPFAQVKPALEMAGKRFPHLARKLEPISAAWAARAALPIAPAPPVRQDRIPALKTKSGQTYTEWRIAGIEGANAVLSHADGVTRVPISEFPDDLSQYPSGAIAPVQAAREVAAQRRVAELERKAREAEALRAAEVERMAKQEVAKARLDAAVKEPAPGPAVVEDTPKQEQPLDTVPGIVVVGENREEIAQTRWTSTTINADGTVTYFKGGWISQVHFNREEVVAVFYSGLDNTVLTSKEVNRLLSENSRGSVWKNIEGAPGNKVKMFQTVDGHRAALLGDSWLQVSISIWMDEYLKKTLRRP